MTLEYRPRVCKSKLNQLGDADVVVGVCFLETVFAIAELRRK